MNQEQYISGGHDNGRDFYHFQGELSKRFYFTPGDYWGERNAKQAAAQYRDEVIAARSAIAGKKLEGRAAVFGPEKPDPRDFETKRQALQRLQQFSLAQEVDLTEGERELLAAKKQIESEHRSKDHLLSPGERAAKKAKDKIEREREAQDKKDELTKFLNDTVQKQLLQAVKDLEEIAKWNDTYTAEDLENLQKVRMALSNPEWKQAGRDYAKSYFAAEKVRRDEANARTKATLDQQEHAIAMARKAAVDNVPTSVVVARSILNGQVAND